MAKKNTALNIFSDKIKFLDGAEASLGSSFSQAEKWLLDSIIKQVLPELDVLDGQILPTTKNIETLTSKLNKVMEGLRTGRNKDIVESVIKNMKGITKINGEYFGVAGDLAGKKFTAAKKGVEGIMRRTIGFNPDGTIKPKSFIDSISNLDDINNTIRDSAIRNIQGGNSVKDFTAELEESILTNKDGLGILNKNRNQIISDRYAQYDRAESKSFADVMEMQAFLYAGGKVQDTRRFCCQRNGIVFTRDEARVWSGLTWQGKNSGYVPLIDLGGYNCRHSPQWISNRVAMRRRPDLIINDEGKLVSKTGRRQPPLHKGCSD